MAILGVSSQYHSNCPESNGCASNCAIADSGVETVFCTRCRQAAGDSGSSAHQNSLCHALSSTSTKNNAAAAPLSQLLVPDQPDQSAAVSQAPPGRRKRPGFKVGYARAAAQETAAAPPPPSSGKHFAFVNLLSLSVFGIRHSISCHAHWGQ